MNPLLQLLEERTVAILDGGMGTELEARGHDVSDELWSARLLRDEPAAIAEVHRDFVTAGADVLLTATYQATLASISKAQFRSAVELARDAHPAVVAVSVGPYGAARADGSEYTGDYDLDEERLYAWHAERFGLLASLGADVLACETIPSAPEARALLRLVEDTPAAEVWFSFCCPDERHLSDGTCLEEIVREVQAHERVLAIGVNCTAPAHVTPLLEIAAGQTSKALLCYPNSGERWDAQKRGWCMEAATFEPRAVADWIAIGARLVGGCCRTRPADIRALARAVAAGA